MANISRTAAVAFALSSFVIGVSARSLTTVATAGRKLKPVKLHMYDHCPYCIRVELYLLRNSIPYTRHLYNYGSGAPPSKKGYDSHGGPKVLMGSKVLPVLETSSGLMLGESLEIVNWLTHSYPITRPVGCAADPGGYKEWRGGGFGTVKSKLVRPRITNLTHLKDWSDPRDVEYARHKYSLMGFDYAAALSGTASLVSSMNVHLSDLAAVLEEGEGGGITVQKGGFSMDDICLLPDLRSLTVVEGIVWPKKVRRYLEEGCRGVELYDDYKS
ncbi:hypothetical protein TrRE_jg9958 [Triparma retinervis]|uniref:GST N-terminal domain-containing protein n=1 Tax=Triparma retinervis TaxID=2557542 RepID=A0A9W7AHE0_9STRA|nr:hypothetical protein TrRE_jg9958 [Triparma retinervis]